MSREDDLVGAIISYVQAKAADNDSKEMDSSAWFLRLEDMCNELDALREQRETAHVLELLRR